MYGEDAFGLLIIIGWILFFFGILTTTRIGVYFLSKAQLSKQLFLFCCWMIFLLTIGIVVLLFYFFRVDLLLPYFFYCSIAAGVYGYVQLEIIQPAWWLKLSSQYTGMKKYIIDIGMMIAGSSLFALTVFGIVKLL
jgi:hypothetical protein